MLAGRAQPAFDPLACAIKAGLDPDCGALIAAARVKTRSRRRSHRLGPVMALSAGRICVRPVGRALKPGFDPGQTPLTVAAAVKPVAPARSYASGMVSAMFRRQ